MFYNFSNNDFDYKKISEYQGNEISNNEFEQLIVDYSKKHDFYRLISLIYLNISEFVNHESDNEEYNEILKALNITNDYINDIFIGVDLEKFFNIKVEKISDLEGYKIKDASELVFFKGYFLTKLVKKNHWLLDDNAFDIRANEEANIVIKLLITLDFSELEEISDNKSLWLNDKLDAYTLQKNIMMNIKYDEAKKLYCFIFSKLFNDVNFDRVEFGNTLIEVYRMKDYEFFNEMISKYHSPYISVDFYLFLVKKIKDKKLIDMLRQEIIDLCERLNNDVLALKEYYEKTLDITIFDKKLAKVLVSLYDEAKPNVSKRAVRIKLDWYEKIPMILKEVK